MTKESYSYGGESWEPEVRGRISMVASDSGHLEQLVWKFVAMADAACDSRGFSRCSYLAPQRLTCASENA